MVRDGVPRSRAHPEDRSVQRRFQREKRNPTRIAHSTPPPHAEVKVIRCSRGSIYDVVVDLRPDSPTFKGWLGVELSAINGKMLYVPEGCAQGYLTLEDQTEMYYHTSQFYAPKHAFGVRYNDPAFGIRWPIPLRVVSERDRSWPDFDTSKTSTEDLQ